MLIRFKCSQCGTHVKIDAQHATKKAKCPGCSQSVQIPAYDQARDEYPAEADALPQKSDPIAETIAYQPALDSASNPQPGEPASANDDLPFSPFQSPGEINDSDMFAGEGGLANAQYGGFWRRSSALVIDRLVLLGIALVMLLALRFAMLIIAMSPEGIQVFFMAVVNIMEVTLSWLYFAVMESSSKQATVGKMAMGMKVVDGNGGRISFGCATRRFFSKFISAILLGYGFWRVAFEPRKRGLHDEIAGTFVIVVR